MRVMVRRRNAYVVRPHHMYSCSDMYIQQLSFLSLLILTSLSISSYKLLTLGKLRILVNTKCITILYFCNVVT